MDYADYDEVMVSYLSCTIMEAKSQLKIIKRFTTKFISNAPLILLILVPW